MITGAADGGVLYSLTSVPQMPATSIFISALSAGISGIGNSRISVLLGPVLTAASTLSTIMSEFLMLAPAKKSATRLESASRVKAWTRARFDLGDAATIFVS